MVKLGLGSLQRLWAPPEPKGRPVLILKSVVFESQGSHRSALQGPARSPAYIVEMLMGLVRVAGGAGRRNECPLEVWSTNGALCIFEFRVADIGEKRNEGPLEVWSTKRERELITHSAQPPRYSLISASLWRPGKQGLGVRRWPRWPPWSTSSSSSGR